MNHTTTELYIWGGFFSALSFPKEKLKTAFTESHWFYTTPHILKNVIIAEDIIHDIPYVILRMTSR